MEELCSSRRWPRPSAHRREERLPVSHDNLMSTGRNKWYHRIENSPHPQTIVRSNRSLPHRRHNGSDRSMLYSWATTKRLWDYKVVTTGDGRFRFVASELAETPPSHSLRGSTRKPETSGNSVKLDQLNDPSSLRTDGPVILLYWKFRFLSDEESAEEFTQWA